MKNSMSHQSQRIIAVDLDGTLVQTDLLIENLFLFLRLFPLRILEVISWVFKGKAHFKRRLADEILPDVSSLPYNQELLEWLKLQRTKGATLLLATASDVRIAQKVADYLGIFEEVFGTEVVNLSSINKQQLLVQRFGERGYEYVGNSLADLAVWKSASWIHIANPEIGVSVATGQIGSIGQIFSNRSPYFQTVFKALRIHHWTKNLLIFVPLAASHRFLETKLIFIGWLAFLAFGACASSVYLLNDLLDLPDDRNHSTKRHRPLAAGSFPIMHALILIPALLFGAFGLALWLLPLQFTSVLAAYYVLTLVYSLWLKRVVMLDVVILAILYTARVVAGSVAMTLVATFWILAFCMFIFLSLALIKRYTELRETKMNDQSTMTSGRGYYATDFELLASLGTSSGYIAVLVLALYINDTTSSNLYHSPQWMWAACPLLLFWLSRVWLLAHRGKMHDDPIVFALRDNVSRWIGVAFIIVFTLAAY